VHGPARATTGRAQHVRRGARAFAETTAAALGQLNEAELDANGAPTGNRIPTPEGDRRVPDIISISPNGCTTYIIDVHIA
jgi:hypothetical protein